MKLASFALLGFLVGSVAACAQSDAPVLIPENKIAIRDIQHDMDTIEKQQKDLALQFDTLQQKVLAESQRLQKLHEDKQKELDAAVEKAMSGVDAKKWSLDRDKLIFSATPAPAVPANAFAKPAETPTSTPSPGAAVPPKIQEAKK